MKKLLGKLTLCMVILAFSMLSAFAAISSTSTIDATVNKLYRITNFDSLSLINKGELIGQRLDNFNLRTSKYKREMKTIQDRLIRIKSQIEEMERLQGASESSKKEIISKLYQDAESSISEIDSKTLDYLYTVRGSMPSMTYQRYAKSFKEYYNSIGF